MGLALAGSGFLAPPAWSQAPKNANETFDLFDRNGDGVIERTESDFNKIFVFAAFDTNQNNNLDRSEVNLSDENFRKADKDNNGRISPVEYLNAPFGKFEAADSNRDQVVTREELKAYMDNLKR